MCTLSCVCTLIGSAFGLLGASVFLVTYFAVAALRTPTRRFLLCLSLADLLLAVTLGAVHLFGDLDATSRDEFWCLALGAPLVFSLTASALWSACVAVVVHRKITHPWFQPSVRLTAAAHAVCWGYPLACVGAGIVVASAAHGRLSYQQGGICLAPISPFLQTHSQYVWVSFRGPVMACVFLSVLVCGLAYRHLRRPPTEESEVAELLFDNIPAHTRQLATRLLWLPFCFILTRGFGTFKALFVIFGLKGRQHELDLCIGYGLDGMQGFCNCLIFVALNPELVVQLKHRLGLARPDLRLNPSV